MTPRLPRDGSERVSRRRKTKPRHPKIAKTAKITSFECRARKANAQENNRISTLLTDHLFAVIAHSHHAHQFGICVSMEGEGERVRERDTERESERHLKTRTITYYVESAHIISAEQGH